MSDIVIASLLECFNMRVYIGKIQDYSSFALLEKAYRIEYGREISQNDIIFQKDGKPCFKNKGMPCFNISHSGEYVACIFSTNEVGIDIQKIRKIHKRVVGQYLHTRSNEPIEQIVEWTRFESYGKMTGSGIPPEDDYDNGYFLTTTELEDYIITVCIDKEFDQAFEKIPICLDRYGNTSAPAAAMALCDAYGKVSDETIKTMFCCFGVGLSWGVASVNINASDIYPIFETDEVFEQGFIDKPL